MISFPIEYNGKGKNASKWFTVKKKYLVKIPKDLRKTSEEFCTCIGDTFRQSGRRQRQCKHIMECRKFSKAMEEQK